MKLTFAKIGKRQEKQGFGVRQGTWISVLWCAHVNSEMPIIHPIGDVKQIAGYVQGVINQYSECLNNKILLQ